MTKDKSQKQNSDHKDEKAKKALIQPVKSEIIKKPELQLVEKEESALIKVEDEKDAYMISESKAQQKEVVTQSQAKQEELETEKTKEQSSQEKSKIKKDKSEVQKKAKQDTDKKQKAVKSIKEKPGQWFIIHTYSGHENKVNTAIKQRVESLNLSGRIFEVVVPTRNIVTVRAGKKQEIKEKIFPGYILVRMILDDKSWLAMRTTPGVTGFVGVGNQPTPIRKKEVDAILRFMEIEAPKYKARFSVGEAVKIIDGPFADFLGTINEIDEDKGKVKILVSIFGRETPVELDFLQISKL